MTVISAIINKQCTVHASDSLITEAQKDKTKKVLNHKQSKIVTVRAWKGAISYWGLASYKGYKWSTFEWLKKKAGSANKYRSAEEFAQHLTQELNEKASKMKFAKKIDRGIGLHFTAYEKIGNLLIPELFLITNYKGPPYKELYPKIRLFRNTLASICGMKAEETKTEHRELPYRKIVHEVLQSGRFLIFNNGDPGMFNVIMPTIFRLYQIFGQRRILKDSSKIKLETYHDIAHMLLNTIIKAQEGFCDKNQRLVGGKIHVLAISPKGEYYSKTGDED